MAHHYSMRRKAGAQVMRCVDRDSQTQPLRSYCMWCTVRTTTLFRERDWTPWLRSSRESTPSQSLSVAGSLLTPLPASAQTSARVLRLGLGRTGATLVQHCGLQRHQPLRPVSSLRANASRGHRWVCALSPVFPAAVVAVFTISSHERLTIHQARTKPISPYSNWSRTG